MVDLFLAMIMAVIICTGWRSGVIAEFVKLFGIFCTVFITLHYYERFADFLRVQFFGKDASTEFVAFCILAVLFAVMFLAISRGWTQILKLNFPAAVDRYGGLSLAIVRSYFTCGLVFFGLILLQHSFITPEAKRSVSGVIFRYVATDMYRASYASLVRRSFPGENINEEAIKLMAPKTQKKQAP